MSYKIYFQVENNIYILPVNPEEISISKNQKVKELDILKLGKVAIPLGTDLTEISFSAEIPGKKYSYCSSGANQLYGMDMIREINRWRENKKKIQFIAYCDGGDKLSLSVIITGLSYKEKAFEEGDYYVSFKMKEYRDWKVDIASSILDGVRDETAKAREQTKPKPKGKPYVIKQGDTLWAIARKFYGDGSKYPEIFNANRGVLGDDPDLIFPEQKIIIPEKEE